MTLCNKCNHLLNGDGSCLNCKITTNEKPAFGPIELVDRELFYISFNRRDT